MPPQEPARSSASGRWRSSYGMRGRQLVVLAGGRQASVEGGLASRSRPPADMRPTDSYPFLHVGLEGRLRRLGPAAARRRWLRGAGQRLLPGADPGRRLRLPGRSRPARRRATSTSPPGACCCKTSPLAVRWTRAARWPRRRRIGQVILPPPKSAKLPAVRDEIRQPINATGKRLRHQNAATSGRPSQVASSFARSEASGRWTLRLRGPGAAAEGQQPDLAVPDRDGRADRRQRPRLHLAAQLPDATSGSTRSASRSIDQSSLEYGAIPYRITHPTRRGVRRSARSRQVCTQRVPGRGRLPGHRRTTRRRSPAAGRIPRTTSGRSRSTRSPGT